MSEDIETVRERVMMLHLAAHLESNDADHDRDAALAALASLQAENEGMRSTLFEIWDEAERAKKHVGRGWLLRRVGQALEHQEGPE